MKSKVKFLVLFLVISLLGFKLVAQQPLLYTKDGAQLYLWTSLPTSGFFELPNGDLLVKSCLEDHFGIDFGIKSWADFQFFDSTGAQLVYNGGAIRDLLPNKKIALYKMPEKIFKRYVHIEQNSLGTVDRIVCTGGDIVPTLDTLKICFNYRKMDGQGLAYTLYDSKGTVLPSTCGPNYYRSVKKNKEVINQLDYRDLRNGDSLRFFIPKMPFDSCTGCLMQIKDTIFSQKLIVKVVGTPSLPDIVTESKLCPNNPAILFSTNSSSEITWHTDGGQTGSGVRITRTSPITVYYRTAEKDNNGCFRRSNDYNVQYDSTCSSQFRVNGRVSFINYTNSIKGIPNVKMKLQSRSHDSLYAFAFTDAEGRFDINVPWINVGGSDLFIADSNYYSVQLFLTDLHRAAGNFRTYLLANNDVEAMLWSGRNRPGFTMPLTLSLLNKGKKANAGKLTYQLDNKYTYVSSSLSPSTVSGNTLTWNLDTLYSNDERKITVYAQLPANTVLGSTVTSTLSFSTAVPDEDPANNIVTLTDTVRGSWDPNDKAVHVENGYSRNHIKDISGLEYVIRFQNMGTDTASTIVVKDILSSSLDFGRFEMLDASHPYSISKKGDTLSWTFSNILLPDNKTDEPRSHGFVRFKIQPQKGLRDGTEISNQAAIYFDFNEPVMTNTVTNIVGEPAPLGFANSTLSVGECLVFPNPSEGKVTVQTQMEGKFLLFDAMGRQVWSEQIHRANSMELDGLQKGLYHYQFHSAGKSVSGKLILR